MKHISLFLTIFMILISMTLLSQWSDGGTWIKTNDNVGIGGHTNSHSLNVRSDKPGWQGAFVNRGGPGANVYVAHGAGYGMHIRANTNDGKYTLSLFNKDARTNIFYNNGDVGLGLVGKVGIGTISPTEKLHVNGNMRANIIMSTSRRINFGPVQHLSSDAASALFWKSNHSNNTQLVLRDKENAIYGRLYGSGNGVNFGLLDGDSNWSYLAVKDRYTSFLINNSEKMKISSNGQVKIPSVRDASAAVGSGTLEIGNALRIDDNEIITNTNKPLYLNYNNNGNVSIDNTTFNVIASKNCVKIGDVSTAASDDYKLFVEKGILSEKVRVAVKNTSAWADYVFDDTYEKLPIDKVREFIAENRHLPNVPSAQEVVEDGVDMAEMDAILLRQIEELWLHVIDLKKENEDLRDKFSEKK